METTSTNCQQPDKCEPLNEAKYEIEILRKQIDNLNMNCLNIRKQNFVLDSKLKEFRAKNEELEAVQKEKNELFALIIHDIKNPTTIIKSLVELLRTYDTNNEEQQAIIADLVTSTKQIVSLSQEISKVLTLEGTMVQMFRENANPGQLVAEVARRNSINAKNKDQTISINVEDNLPQFNVDVTKICEVFENIISNSIKYTQFGGSIAISVTRNGDNIQFDFADNGQGMSEEDLKRAFQRGAKLSARPTGDETSSGLGLWVVKKIVEAHKGRVHIKSAVGKGTTFIVNIPLSSGNAYESGDF
ncbi:MAG: HAMP domain-containing histidine kinase [Ignavibacteria bacterium]|jgi:signal transduction histidine kinase|nr:HAMP domain-containing histidine kinase [Ignavibacteria bacterium]